MQEKINEMEQTQGKENKKVIDCINWDQPRNPNAKEFHDYEDEQEYLENMGEQEYLSCFGDLPINQI